MPQKRIVQLTPAKRRKMAARLAGSINASDPGRALWRKADAQYGRRLSADTSRGVGQAKALALRLHPARVRRASMRAQNWR